MNQEGWLSLSLEDQEKWLGGTIRKYARQYSQVGLVWAEGIFDWLDVYREALKEHMAYFITKEMISEGNPNLQNDQLTKA